MLLRKSLIAISASLVAVLAVVPQKLSAVQPLTLKEFNFLCQDYDLHPSQSESRQCARYIKGFIDGAIAADVGIRAEQTSTTETKKSYSQRAINTRIGNRVKHLQPGESSKFCLGDPVAISEVIGTVTENMKHIKDENSSALGAMYQILKSKYPCKTS
jgi:hypothetical protein